MKTQDWKTGEKPEKRVKVTRLHKRKKKIEKTLEEEEDEHLRKTEEMGVGTKKGKKMLASYVSRRNDEWLRGELKG